MNKSVEITVLVELFSTFFEKITLTHPDKDALMKYLSAVQEFPLQQPRESREGLRIPRAIARADPAEHAQGEPRVQCARTPPSRAKRNLSQRKQAKSIFRTWPEFDPSSLNDLKIFRVHKVAEFPGLRSFHDRPGLMNKLGAVFFGERIHHGRQQCLPLHCFCVLRGPFEREER